MIIFEAVGAQETIIDAELVEEAIASVGVAADETAAQLYTMGGGLKAFSAESKLLGAGMMLAGKGIKYSTEAIIGAGVGALYTGIKFQQAMAGVQAVARTNAKGMKELQDLAINASTTTKFSASQSAEAERLLAQAGLNQKNVLQALIPTLDLTTAAQSNVTETAGLMGEVMNAFNLHGSKSTGVANELAYAVQGGAMNLDQLNQAMKYVGAAAYATNQPLSGVIGLLKAMALHGVKGSLAGTTLRFSMTRLIKPVKAVTDGLALINVRQDQLKTGKGLKPMADNLKVIFDHLQALDKNSQGAAVNDIFGVRAFTGIMAILNQGPKAVAQFIKQAQGGTTSAKTMADTINNTIENQLLRFYHILDDIGILIFLKFSPAITAAMKNLDNSLKPLVKHMPELEKLVGEGDWKTAVYMVDDLTGAHGKLAKIIFKVADDLQTMWTFIQKIILPVAIYLAEIIGGFLYVSFQLLIDVMKIFNGHAGLTVAVLKSLLVIYIALRAMTILWNIATYELIGSLTVLDVLTSPEFGIVLGLIAIAAVIYLVYTHAGQLWNWIKGNWLLLGVLMLAPFLFAWLAIKPIFDLLAELFPGLFGRLDGWVDEMTDFIKRPFQIAIDWILGKFDILWNKFLALKNKIDGILGDGPAPVAIGSAGAGGRGGAVGLANFVNQSNGSQAQIDLASAIQNMPLKVLQPLTVPNDILDPGHLRETRVELILDSKVLARVNAKHGQDTKARVKGTTK